MIFSCYNPLTLPGEGSFVRVISGKLKGRKLFSVRGLNLRPTSDRVKEAIFDILQDQIQEKKVLDLFAGTGALGIEALSRGATRAVFIEENTASLGALRRNIEACRLGGEVEVLAREVNGGIRFLESRGESFEVIFLDPPYGKGLARKTIESLAKSPIAAPGGLIIAEHGGTEELESVPPLHKVDGRKYGSTLVSIFKKSIE